MEEYAPIEQQNKRANDSGNDDNDAYHSALKEDGKISSGEGGQMLKQKPRTVLSPGRFASLFSCGIH